MNSNFHRLDPRLREYIYEKKWPFLKSIQEDAIKAILDTQDNVLIAAGTASGKTEACFFPLITQLCNREGLCSGQESGIEALYISPLKALINDQFERLLPLLLELDLKLWRWHGDVDNLSKQKLLEKPEGILQITPESLEALLLRQGSKVPFLFKNLSFVVIDEVHAFIGTDRGSQLLCLLERIREMAGKDALVPRRIGLSATLGNYEEALAWLSSGKEPREAILIREQEGSGKKSQETGRRLSLAVDFREETDFYEAIYEQCQGSSAAPIRKCIVFTNSRMEAEEAAASLKKIARSRGEEDHYQVHHGSIAASLRAETERRLREAESRQVIAATATLELGIDIGKLDRIVQIGAPMSVSAFVQRLGRSGRESGISQMYFCSRKTGEGDSPLERIPWTLLKTIAVIELYLKDKWIEGAEKKPLPYSLICHQTLSILASLGSQSRETLVSRVLSLPVFREVERTDYEELLDTLEAGDYIEKIEDNTLIVGLEGERIISHYSFYSVFPDEYEFRVTFRGKELGKVNFIPPEGAGLMLVGRNWRVISVDIRSREIAVNPGGEKSGRIWRGGASFLHLTVARRMRRILRENLRYPYLTDSAAECLAKGRDFFTSINPDNSPVVRMGETTPNEAGLFWFIPWLGSRGSRVVSLALQNQDIRERLGILSWAQENPYAWRINAKFPAETFRSRLFAELPGFKNPESLLDPEHIPFTDKYDYLLPPRLLLKKHCANMLDSGELAKALDNEPTNLT